MARPEGYRKAIRLMEMADKFGLPVVTLVDTPVPTPARAQKSVANQRPSPAAQKSACNWVYPWYL